MVKDPLGTKGHVLQQISHYHHVTWCLCRGLLMWGVSQRIESEEERERLKRLVEEYCDENGGFIIRTAAEGVGEHEIKQDAF